MLWKSVLIVLCLFALYGAMAIVRDARDGQPWLLKTADHKPGPPISSIEIDGEKVRIVVPASTTNNYGVLDSLNIRFFWRCKCPIVEDMHCLEWQYSDDIGLIATVDTILATDLLAAAFR